MEFYGGRERVEFLKKGLSDHSDRYRVMGEEGGKAYKTHILINCKSEIQIINIIVQIVYISKHSSLYVYITYKCKIYIFMLS